MTQSSMEGHGLYNENSRPQGSAGDLGIPLFERAAAAVPLPADGPLAIADFGSSEGRNSMGPMGAAIAAIRARAAALPVTVTHTDVATNDFSSLFALLNGGAPSYLAGNAGVYGYAVGRSFYGQLFPANALHLAWSAIAVHWMSAVPCAIPGHIFSTFARGAVREAFVERAASDWRSFLDARARELVPGGRLVLVASGAADDGKAGAEGLMTIADAALQAMVASGELPAATYAAMTIPTYYRTRAEWEAPFAGNAALAIEEMTPVVLADPFYPAYERSGDAQAFATSYAAFFRAFSEPCLFGETGGATADAFYARVRTAIAADPATAVCRWQLFLMRIRRV
ncbi:MAG TPA: hypothetical protein VIG46_01320 [Candidatus Baltobacteraceae bacterium]|jgi:hypothetical protein